MLPRFYQSSIQAQDGIVLITDKTIIHQLTKILRLKKNDVFIIFSPKAEYEMAIKNISNHQLQATIIDQRQPEREPDKKLTLYQSLLKKDKFEWILQKGVELGVHTFVPIISDNSIVRNTSKNKLTRYQKIIREATEQCGGQRLTTLKQALPFKQAVENLKESAGQKIIAWEGELKNKLSEKIDQHVNEYHLFIGPEGGFSPSEIELAKVNNFTTISLGRRILRAETAAISAISLILLN